MEDPTGMSDTGQPGAHRKQVPQGCSFKQTLQIGQ